MARATRSRVSQQGKIKGAQESGLRSAGDWGTSFSFSTRPVLSIELLPPRIIPLSIKNPGPSSLTLSLHAKAWLRSPPFQPATTCQPVDLYSSPDAPPSTTQVPPSPRFLSLTSSWENHDLARPDSPKHVSRLGPIPHPRFSIVVIMRTKKEAKVAPADHESQVMPEQPVEPKDVPVQEQQQPGSDASSNAGGILGSVEGELIDFKTLHWL